MGGLSAEQIRGESKALCDFIKNGDAVLLDAFLLRNDLPLFASAASSDGEFPILVAAKRSNCVALSALLNAGVDPSTRFSGPGTFAGYTAVHFAAGNDDIASLEALAAAHAEVDAVSDEGWSPLHVAAYKGKHRALEWLVDHGADVNAVTKSTSQCPLLFAVSHGRPADVRTLLKRGAKTTIVTDENGNTILHHACGYPMSKLLGGQYDVPDVQLDVLVALLLGGETDPAQVNAEGHVATFYWAEKLHSIPQFCECLFRCRAQLRTSKYEWNYMSLVTAKASAFTSAGVARADADKLFELGRAIDEERLLSSMRVPKPSHGLLPSADVLSAVGGFADPSGGKCPFFQRQHGDNRARAQASPGSYKYDPSGGRCPFFKGLPSGPSTADAAAACPFSLTFVKRHSMPLMVMSTCFFLGAAADRLLLKWQRSH